MISEPKQQGVTHLGIVQGLDAEEIPGAEELPLLLVPNGEGEHAPQFVQKLWAVLLIAVEQHLRVGLGGEHVALLEQLLPQGPVVVDLPVEDEHLAAVLVENGLAAALQVDDGQPAKAQGDLPVPYSNPRRPGPRWRMASVMDWSTPWSRWVSPSADKTNKSTHKRYPVLSCYSLRRAAGAASQKEGAFLRPCSISYCITNCWEMTGFFHHQREMVIFSQKYPPFPPLSAPLMAGGLLGAADEVQQGGGMGGGTPSPRLSGVRAGRASFLTPSAPGGFPSPSAGRWPGPRPGPWRPG